MTASLHPIDILIMFAVAMVVLGLSLWALIIAARGAPEARDLDGYMAPIVRERRELWRSVTEQSREAADTYRQEHPE